MWGKLPSEIIHKIFMLLRPESLTTCRAVCRRWREYVDGLIAEDESWEYYCNKYYSDICQTAHIKSNLTWRNLYKSLAIWPKIDKEYKKERTFSIAENYAQTNVNFQLLRNGIVGVLKVKSVVYYNVNTLQKLPELTINGNDSYYDYKENDDLILLHNREQQLLIRRKAERNFVFAMVSDVSLFKIIGNVIYYSSTKNLALHKCVYANDVLKHTLLPETNRLVLSLGHKNDKLYVLTKSFHVYELIDDILVLTFQCRSIREEFEILSQYNFANNVDWTNPFSGMILIHDTRVANMRLNHLLSIRTYGPVVFGLFLQCIVRIYHSLYETPLLNLLNSAPIENICLNPESEHSSKMEILNLDVIEGEKKHTIIIAKENMMYAIEYDHSIPKVQSLQCSEGSSHSREDPSTSGEIRSRSSEEPLAKIAKK